MQIESDRHFADDLLEKYSMGHLPEEQVAVLEEHLYVCSDCQMRLTSIDEYVQVMKGAAAAELERAGADRKPSFADTLWGRFWPIPKPVWALSLAFASSVVVFSVLSPVRVGPRPQTELTLSASRGDASWMPHAAKNADVVLKIDTASIAPAPVYELRLVNASGKEMWKGAFSPANQQIVAKVPALNPGQYWVRIYRASDLENPLQEYGVVIE